VSPFEKIPAQVRREITVSDEQLAEWRRILVTYLADRALQALPVPRGPVLWFTYATDLNRRWVMVEAERLAESLLASRCAAPARIPAGAAPSVIRGDGWAVTATSRWDVTTATTRDAVTVSLARRRP
jgi:hypothetical protein